MPQNMRKHEEVHAYDVYVYIYIYICTYIYIHIHTRAPYLLTLLWHALPRFRLEARAAETSISGGSCSLQRALPVLGSGEPNATKRY